MIRTGSLVLVTVGLLLMVGCSNSSATGPAESAVMFATLEGEDEGMFTGGLRADLGWSEHDVYVSPDGECAAVALTFDESPNGALMVLANHDEHTVAEIYGDQYPEDLDELEDVLGESGWIPTSLNAQRLDDVNVGGYRVGLVTFGPKCQLEYHLE